MGLFGHMRIHDSGIHRNADNTDTPSTPSDPSLLTAIAVPHSMNDIPPATPIFFCPHCTRNFNARIGLVGHLRIHRTEAGEPDPSQVWWHAQGRLRPRQPPVPTPISGLLDCVMRPRLRPRQPPAPSPISGLLDSVLTPEGRASHLRPLPSPVFLTLS
ncbi:unnamed protein product [Schistocephalus solidus]|uniref:C2H2-type domain-containing protein n=1 Tax=Schistocephalus solidus TaxID=70667 RepID=A0A183S7I7_SCHSO|nr:unnamed protein product [Schistocephalus solidus]